MQEFVLSIGFHGILFQRFSEDSFRNNKISSKFLQVFPRKLFNSFCRNFSRILQKFSQRISRIYLGDFRRICPQFFFRSFPEFLQKFCYYFHSILLHQVLLRCSLRDFIRFFFRYFTRYFLQVVWQVVLRDISEYLKRNTHRNLVTIFGRDCWKNIEPGGNSEQISKKKILGESQQEISEINYGEKQSKSISE